MIHQLTKLISIVLALTFTLLACGQTEGEVVENFVGDAGGYGIFGRVWLDADGDGLQDIGEAGLSGAPVTLLADGLLIDATITGQDGAYKFENLPAQDYVVEFEAPPGFVFSPKDQADDKLDSDANPSTGRTDTIKERSGLFILNVDAGLIPPSPENGSLQAATPTPSETSTTASAALSFVHTQPGVESEVYLDITGSPGVAVKFTLSGGNVISQSVQEGVIGEDGTLRLTWRITAYGEYTASGDVGGEPFVVKVSVE